MQIKDISGPNIRCQQDYWLLGAVIAGTLFIIPLIWLIAVSVFTLAGDINDPLAFDNIGSKIDILFYCIDWILILLSFVGYHFLNTFFNLRMESGIKQRMSRTLFALSIMALLALHSLFLIKLMTGANDAPVMEVVILVIAYVLSVSATIISSFNSRINGRLLQHWTTRWISIIFVAGIILLLGCSIYALLPSFSPESMQSYFKPALWLWTFDFSWIGSLITFVSLLLVLVLVALEDKYPVKNRWLPLLLDIGVTLSIFYSVFNMNFFTYDSNFYMGPIYDVLHGKALLVNNYSQYGLLNIYCLSAFFNLPGIPLTYGNFMLFLTLSTIAGYIFVYLLLRCWLRNITLSVLGIYMIVLWNYFGGYIYKLGHQLFPQMGFLRFGWWLPIMFLLLIRTTYIHAGSRGHLQKLLHVIELALVTLAFFWEFDTGIYILGAYIAVLFVEAFNNESDYWTKMKSFLHQIIELTGTLLLIFILISTFTYTAVQKWPDWYGFIWPALSYATVTAGYGAIMMKTPVTGIHVLFMCVYAFSISYIVVNLFLDGGKYKRDLPVLAFITSFGILQYLYYFGTIQPFRLRNVVIPLVLVICWFALKAIKYLRTQEGTIYLKQNIAIVGLASLVALMLISVPVQMMTCDMATTVANRGDIIGLIEGSNDPNKWIPQNMHPGSFLVSVRTILEKEADNKDVAIISYWDTYFLIKTGKTNIVDSNNLNLLDVSQPQLQLKLDRLAGQILSVRPDTLYIEISDDGPGKQVEYLKDKIAGMYYLAENVGRLDRYMLRWKYRTGH